MLIIPFFLWVIVVCFKAGQVGTVHIVVRTRAFEFIGEIGVNIELSNGKVEA